MEGAMNACLRATPLQLVLDTPSLVLLMLSGPKFWLSESLDNMMNLVDDKAVQFHFDEKRQN